VPHVAEELVIRPEREADHRAIADVVRAAFVRQVEQPFPRGIHIRPRLLHPLEPERAVLNLERRDYGRFIKLSARRLRPHYGKRAGNVIFRQCARQRNTVIPHTADGIRRHQDAHLVSS